MRTSVGTLLIDLSNSGLAAACARAGTRNIAERSIADAVCHRVVASEQRTDELVFEDLFAVANGTTDFRCASLPIAAEDGIAGSCD